MAGSDNKSIEVAGIASLPAICCVSATKTRKW
jgi:hypothetical protein